MHRDALHRRIDVQTLERAVARKRFEIAVDQNAFVRQFAAALALIDRERADAAVNIDPAIGLRCAGIVAELVELFLLRRQRFGERFQHQRALMKRQRTQRRAAMLAREARHRAEVDALR